MWTVNNRFVSSF